MFLDVLNGPVNFTANSLLSKLYFCYLLQGFLNAFGAPAPQPNPVQPNQQPSHLPQPPPPQHQPPHGMNPHQGFPPMPPGHAGKLLTSLQAVTNAKPYLQFIAD